MFRDRLGQAAGKNLQVLGVSIDDPASHLSFIRNLGLNFPLASDTDGELCRAMGTCPGFERGSSRFFTNMVRAAFAVEVDGTISAIYNANGGPNLIAMIWDTTVSAK